MKKEILFITKDSILKKLLEGGGSPNGRLESLLGYNLIDENKYKKILVNLPRGEVKSLTQKICHLLGKPFLKITRLGIALEAYPLFKKEIKAAETIVCVTDGIGLGLLLWKRLGFVKAKIIVIMMGLPEKTKNIQRLPFLRHFISSLLSRAATVLTLSDCAGETLKQFFRLPAELVKTFRYGADTDYWQKLPEIKKESFILSIGNDGNRDFKTLIGACAPLLSGNGQSAIRRLKIITKLLVETKEPKIEILNTFFTGDDLKILYNQALFAVIPSVKRNVESPGLSSALQIMASGTAVIISRLPALEELFVDGEDCLFYEPENKNDLREKINLLLNDKNLRDKLAENGREKVLKKYNCRKMAEQLEKLLD